MPGSCPLLCAGKWLLATPAGRMVRVEVDAQSPFTFVDRRDGSDDHHVGEYLEVVPPTPGLHSECRKLPVSTRVTIDVAPAKNGCTLTLTHDGVLPEWVDRTPGLGWPSTISQICSTPPGVEVHQAVATAVRLPVHSQTASGHGPTACQANQHWPSSAIITIPFDSSARLSAASRLRAGVLHGSDRRR